jgi:hypothetical protein
VTPKIPGHCTLCDAEVFDIVARPPSPWQVGKPHADAMRVTFFLFGGSTMDLTFCEACANALEPSQFPTIWNRVMLSWEAESPGHPGGAKAYVDDGIVGIQHIRHWTEVLA